jgi:hypothetical protein
MSLLPIKLDAVSIFLFFYYYKHLFEYEKIFAVKQVQLCSFAQFVFMTSVILFYVKNVYLHAMPFLHHTSILW